MSKLPQLVLTATLLGAVGCADGHQPTEPGGPAFILGGEIDDVRHQEVGALCIVVTDGDPWACFPGAAVLVSPKVMVSVAHAGPFLTAINPARIGMSFDVTPNPNSDIYEATYYAHPAWNPGDPANPMDLGVFVLRDAVTNVRPAQLPAINFLNAQSVEHGFFTIVGYGLATLEGWPTQPQWGTRRSGHTSASTLNVGSIITAANSGQQTACFGDSGSALFFRNSNILVGTYSAPLSGDCSQGLYTRLDSPQAHAWLHQFID